MNEILIWFLIQGFLGAFDTLYHHEFTERLPWRPTAGRELQLHGVRNAIYVVVFVSLAWLEWGGVLAWLFMALLGIEIIITLWDFVIEDKTRFLPATERITHTLLTLNYGVILALLGPELMRWSQLSTAWHPVSYGLASWLMSFYAVGVLIWAVRDYSRSQHLLTQTNYLTSTPTLPLPSHLTLNQREQRILVTGATGLLGSRLVQILIQDGHHVTVLLHKQKHLPSFWQGKITLIDDLAQLQTPIDVVINLAGSPVSVPWTIANKSKIRKSRLETTQKLLDTLAHHSIQPHTWLNGSAIGIYGTHEQTIFDESSAIQPQTDFATQLCHDWETLAEQAKTLGVKRVCHLRTGVVLSTGGGALASMLLPFEFGLGGVMGSGKQTMSWVHVDDWLAMVIHTLNTPTLIGAINLTSPHAVTYRELAHALGCALHRPAWMPMPAWLLARLMGEMGQTLILQGQRVYPERMMSSGYVFSHPHLLPALKHLLQHGR